jgi:hypothetical protein
MFWVSHHVKIVNIPDISEEVPASFFRFRVTEK